MFEKEGGVDFETTIIREGSVQITVPKFEYYRVSLNEYVPSKAPVFYNPLMKENRDLTVIVARIFRREADRCLCFGDSMAGVGVRSMRILVESEWDEAYVNDNSQRAFSIILRNIKLNGLEEKAHPYKMDANVFQATHSSTGDRFDMLDIDPFGTPVGFLDTGVQAVKHSGVLSVTATDTANLFGVHRRAAQTLYGVRTVRTGFMRELGVRTLLKALAEAAARHGRGFEPIVSVASRHYVKVLVKILKGKSHAFKTVSQIKFLKIRGFGKSYEPIGVVDAGEAGEKDGCLIIGPLYTGELCSKEWLEKTSTQQYEKQFFSKNMCRIIDRLLLDNEKTVGGFDLIGLASSLHVNPPNRNLVVEKLLRKGFAACRSGLDPNCIRTNAGLEELTSIIKNL